MVLLARSTTFTLSLDEIVADPLVLASSPGPLGGGFGDEANLVLALLLQHPQIISAVHNIIRGKLDGKVFTNGWPDFSATVCQFGDPVFDLVGRQ